ncbi:MAG TPA: hypothetical protein PKK37_03120 [Candidatus Pacearchaeota archaeon]|nr:MAG: hypothetical protein YFSK_1340 [Candidatus Yanofskybacteria bacterium]HNR81401.1 hypothetical protein [Candidatus Pacearchaeota archaeon]
MSIIQKVIMGAAAVALAVGGYFAANYFSDANQKNTLDTPERIAADYQNLLDEAKRLEAAAGADCGNKKDINRQIEALENKLADLDARKKQWLDSVPELPDVELEIRDQNDPNRPGSQVPELSSDVPPLPDVNVEVIPGSEVPELTSDVPPLPEINIELIESADYIPEMPEIPEINPGRPGSEVPELTSDVPPLPEIDEADIINPDEPIFQMEDAGQKINNILQRLKALCQEDAPVKKPVSDKCSDACQRHKDCAAFTEDATPADLNDAYSTCMEECVAWPVEMVKCINAIDINVPNDCVGFLNCQLPQYYEEKYLK